MDIETRFREIASRIGHQKTEAILTLAEALLVSPAAPVARVSPEAPPVPPGHPITAAPLATEDELLRYADARGLAIRAGLTPPGKLTLGTATKKVLAHRMAMIDEMLAEAEAATQAGVAGN